MGASEQDFESNTAHDTDSEEGQVCDVYQG
jgi:hypothetical protein